MEKLARKAFETAILRSKIFTELPVPHCLLSSWLYNSVTVLQVKIIFISTLLRHELAVVARQSGLEIQNYKND